MIGLLSALPLPTVLQDKIIAAELEYARIQSEYFKSLSLLDVTREEVTPVVYVPVFEPDEANLVAIFVEPGLAHLVFKDEIAPTKDLDERYRQERKKIFGRTADVESVELSGSEAVFTNNYSGIQLYETSLHFASVLPYHGVIYSNTWNHLLSTNPCLLIKLRGGYIRGGYKRVEARVIKGDRTAAEEWAKSESVQK